MDLFSEFCNICYKSNDGSLKDISEENMKHLKDTLITFVGHTDIIKHNVIYLCQLCCEELIRLDKFREMCMSNLIQLRQRICDMTFKLDFEDGTCTVRNALQKCIREQVLRRKSLEKSNYPVEISMEYHEIVKGSANINDSVFSRQVINLKLESNECEFDDNCSDVSVTNNVIDCAQSGVAVTNETDMKNEILRRSEDTMLEEFHIKYDGDFDVSNINDGNESNASQIDFIKEEFDLKNEIESKEHVKIDVKMPVNYSERNFNSGIDSVKEECSDNTNLSKFERKLNGDFDISNINDGNESNASQIDFIKEEFDLKNEIEPSEHVKIDVKMPVNYSERNFNSGIDSVKEDCYDNTNLSKFERKLNEDFDIYDINNAYVRNTSHIEFIQVENFPLKHLENDFGQYAKVDFKNPVVNSIEQSVNSGTDFTKQEFCVKEENISSQDFEMETISNNFGDGLNVGFKIANVSIVNMEDIRYEDIGTENEKRGMNVPSTGCKNESTPASNVEPSHPHGRYPTARDSNKELHTCDVCNKSFGSSTCLIRHQSTHIGDRPYKCSICEKSFLHPSGLSRHKRTHSGEKQYKCSVCNKTFTDSDRRTAHERVHSGIRPYQCTECNKTFTNSSGLNMHKRTHSGDRRYNCTVCRKAFTTSFALTIHERNHSGNRPYKCTVCNKTFTHSSCLTKHERVHSGDRPYKCTVCNKAFRQSAHLNSHKRTHSSETLYKCAVCAKTFTNASNLSKHERTHNDIRP